MSRKTISDMLPKRYAHVKELLTPLSAAADRLCEGGEDVEDGRGGCSLVFHPKNCCGTQKQPPSRYARRPPSQEGSFAMLRNHYQ